MGLYGETPGRVGTGYMVQPHSRDGQGSTHSLKWGRGAQRMGPMQGTWDSGARGEGQEDRGQKERWVRQRCAGDEYTAGLPSPKGGGQGSLPKMRCWAGEHQGEGIGRMGTSKPTDTPFPLQARSPTTAPGKAVAGNLPAPMS